MDYAGDLEALSRFSMISRYLVERGLSAPRVHACDLSQGLALIEDFGDSLASAVLDAGGDEETVYSLAVDTVAGMQQPSDTMGPRVPVLDGAHIRVEISLLGQWLAPEVLGPVDAKRWSTEYMSAWDYVVERAPLGTTCLALGDFEAENIMLLAGRSGIRRCGLLDFQDAVRTDPVFDLVSLLQTSRRDVAPELELRMVARYLAQARPRAAEEFWEAYAFFGAERLSRIAGTFMRLARQGKTRYLRFLPRILRLLERDLQASSLAPLRRLFANSDFFDSARSIIAEAADRNHERIADPT